MSPGTVQLTKMGSAGQSRVCAANRNACAGSGLGTSIRFTSMSSCLQCGTIQHHGQDAKAFESAVDSVPNISFLGFEPSPVLAFFTALFRSGDSTVVYETFDSESVLVSPRAR
jgi:hypothetical protein